MYYSVQVEQLDDLAPHYFYSCPCYTTMVDFYVFGVFLFPLELVRYVKLTFTWRKFLPTYFDNVLNGLPYGPNSSS